MRRRNIIEIILVNSISLILFAAIFIRCGEEGKESKPEKNSDWDIDRNGIPRFVAVDYMELGKIYRISRFRSSIGHDYSDAFEHCRSMKHYFEPKSSLDWSLVKVFSPVSGRITRLDQEWAGTKIEIEADTYPAFRFSIFHVNLFTARKIDDVVTAGEQLGTHIGAQTMSDIAVIVNDPTHQGRMISYFDVMTDSLFTEYSKRGVSSRGAMIISREVRDSSPLTCSGDTFVSSDSLESWVVLK